MNVIIIGSGNRVIDTVVPALSALSDEFNILAITSRNKKTLNVGGCHKVTTIQSFDEIDFTAVGLIIMAASTNSNPSILKTLSKFDTSNAVLLIDTPVLSPKDIFALKFFKNFKKVLAAEDNIALPALVLAKKILDENCFSPHRIIYNKFGYRYHALASLKYLFGMPLFQITSKKLDAEFFLRTIRFEGGRTAFLYEPRDYSDCDFTIYSTGGVISDTVLNTDKVDYHIEYLQQNGVYRGLKLNNRQCPQNHLDKKYLHWIDSHKVSTTLMTSMKIRAYMDLLHYCKYENTNYYYSPIEAFSDNLIFSFIDKLGYYHKFFISKKILEMYSVINSK